MCGIVGILARSGRVSSDLLERATKSLAHRGPDDSGTVLLQASVPENVQVGLGNRRLAILDLSPLGHQPMRDPETGNWIVYNGETYNFRDLRAKLEAEGVRFASHSDTEVLLKAYARWGERCLRELRGMFALAIWDAQRQRLFLARDPMGIKPLYYYEADGLFLFASEVRTLLTTGLVPRRLNRAGLVNYLTFGSVYEPATLVEGVQSLPPGHFLVWENGSIHEEKYWDLPAGGAAQTQASPSAVERKNLEEELSAVLDEAVRLQLVSDVPVGVFLSGGIDSSSLVALLSRHGGVRLNTFSIVFQEADYSEARYSQAIARKFGADHHELLVSQQDALTAIPDALRAMDQPTMDGINTYLVSRKAHEAGVKVALSGLGGDEMFAGYSSFRTVPRMERFARFWNQVPRAIRSPLAAAYAAAATKNDQSRKLAALAGDDGRLLHPYFLSRMLFTPRQRERLLIFDDRHALDAARAPLQAALDQSRALDPINRVSYLEARCYMLNTLLRDADCMSMAHSVEVRVPLIDHKLVERLFAVPGAWKLTGATPKSLLVGALQAELPEEIVHRPKRGFTLPFEHWLRDELRPGIEKALTKMADGPLAGAIDPAGVNEVWRDFARGRTSWSRPWALYVLHRWCELNF